MTSIGTYQVKIQVQSAEEQFALLSPATVNDMPTNWDFDWLGLSPVEVK